MPNLDAIPQVGALVNYGSFVYVWWVAQT